MLGAPALVRAQGKGKVRLAYLQLGWAATEIIHKEDLLGKRGWQAEYSIVPGAPGPLLNQLTSKNVDAVDMSLRAGGQGVRGRRAAQGDRRGHRGARAPSSRARTPA